MWPLSYEMTCFHGLGSSIVNYAISDTHVVTTIHLKKIHIKKKIIFFYL